MTTCTTIADRCGACCYTGFVPLERGEPRDGIPPWMIHERRGSGKPCPALDTDAMRCTIYDVRPRACRRFKPGGGECTGARDAMLSRLTIGGCDEPHSDH